MIRPSQKNDYQENESPLPINVYEQNGLLRIDTGNHRYFTRLKRGDKTSIVRKVKDPYINW